MMSIPRPRLEYPPTGVSAMALHLGTGMGTSAHTSGIAQQPGHGLPGTGRSDCPSSSIPVDFLFFGTCLKGEQGYCSSSV